MAGACRAILWYNRLEPRVTGPASKAGPVLLAGRKNADKGEHPGTSRAPHRLGRRTHPDGRRAHLGGLDPSWPSTGGLASARLLTLVEPQWLVRVAGTIFVLLGCIIFLLGFRTYWEVIRDLKQEEVETTSTWFLRVLTLMLIIVAVIALVLIYG